MLKRKKLLFPFLIVLALSFYPVADTDFGWHLRTGEYIYKNLEVPKQDLFSFSLPNYPYVYYSWAGELLLFTSYKLMGFLGPAIFYSFILTISIYFIFKSSKVLTNSQYWPLFILATPVVHVLAGGRMRVFGLLFFSIFYYLLTNSFQKNSKSLLLIPLFFLLWSNFHASFILGIGILILTLLLKFSYPLLGTLLVSTAAVFANPYGWRIWQQALTITSNEISQLRAINPDWQSPFAHGVGGLIYFFVFSLILIFVIRSKIPLFVKVLNLIIFSLSLVTQRFLFALLVVFLPAANFILLNFIEKFSWQMKTPVVRFSLFSIYFVFALFIVQNTASTFFAHSNFANYTHYLSTMSPNKYLYANWSNKASSLLLTNFSQKNILTDANWGGLLLLGDGNLKLFYYGAMDNFKTNGELFPFIYLSVINVQDNWQKNLDEYKVEVIYLPNNTPLVDTLKGSAEWYLAYRDDKSSIYARD